MLAREDFLSTQTKVFTNQGTALKYFIAIGSVVWHSQSETPITEWRQIPAVSASSSPVPALYFRKKYVGGVQS